MNLDDVVPPPGAALVEDLDKRLLVQLRDGRKIVGTLRHVFLYSMESGATAVSLWYCNIQAIRKANLTLDISECFKCKLNDIDAGLSTNSQILFLRGRWKGLSQAACTLRTLSVFTL